MARVQHSQPAEANGRSSEDFKELLERLARSHAREVEALEASCSRLATELQALRKQPPAPAAAAAPEAEAESEPATVTLPSLEEDMAGPKEEEPAEVEVLRGAGCAAGDDVRPPAAVANAATAGRVPIALPGAAPEADAKEEPAAPPEGEEKSRAFPLDDDAQSERSDRRARNRVSFDEASMAETKSSGSGVRKAQSTITHSGISTFRIKDAWEKPELLEHALEAVTAGMMSKTYSTESLDKNSLPDGRASTRRSSAENEGNKSSIICFPTNRWRLCWDFVGALLIFYDLFTLPMEAFKLPESVFTQGMDWIILVFWTFNVVASVTVGHVVDGNMVLDPKKILVRYLKTWFVVDLVVLVPDWIFSIAALVQDGVGGGNEDQVKLVRVLRLVRMVRLLRLLKLRKIFETFNDMISSEYTSVIVNIVQMIMVLLAVNHLICCVWYTLAEGMQGPTWITEWVTRDDHLDDWVYLYMTSFHWSITQFTPASMDVQPENKTERVFAVVVVVFALVTFSYIVGSITGSLAQLRNMNAEESKLFWDLRRYLVKNKVRAELSLRITKYLEHMWQSMQDSKPVKDVKLINLLSEQLNSELKYALAVTQLKIHPFLKKLCDHSGVTVRRLANTALSHKLLAEGDSLFHPGESATHMYILVKGRYLYRKVEASGCENMEWVDNDEDWIAEPVLWTTRWMHCGLLTAVEHVDNLTIDAESFSEQVKLNPKGHLFTSIYAKNFIDWLNQLPPAQLSDIYQGEDFGDTCRGFIPTRSDCSLHQRALASRNDRATFRGDSEMLS